MIYRFSSIRTPEDIHQSTLSPPAYKYWAMGAYNDSKLCNILFAQELARKWPSVSVFACHPGNLVSTSLSRHWWLYRLLFALVRPFTKSMVWINFLINLYVKCNKYKMQRVNFEKEKI